MGWLTQELTWDQAHGHESRPSSLKYVNIRIRIHSACQVVQLGTAHAKALSEVLSDDRRYPDIRQVKLAVIPDEYSRGLSAMEDGNRHREKIATAMQALEKKGILQLQWRQE
jgi:hypothetical protein